MIDWRTLFLGIIAIATLATALVQIAVIVVAGRLARRVDRLADRLDRELTPLFGHLNAIGRDASRAAALATAQIERADRLFEDIGQRVEQLLNGLQGVVVTPLREAAAFTAAARAVVGVLRDLRRRRARSRAEDEDALFI